MIIRIGGLWPWGGGLFALGVVIHVAWVQAAVESGQGADGPAPFTAQRPVDGSPGSFFALLPGPTVVGFPAGSRHFSESGAIAQTSLLSPEVRGVEGNSNNNREHNREIPLPLRSDSLKKNEEFAQGATIASTGGTRYLLLGGGSTPFNTQVSLEEHLLRAQASLFARGISRDAVTLLFADGQAGGPSIAVTDSTLPRDEAADLLALIQDRTEHRSLTWRPSRFSDVQGTATKATVKEWFGSPGSTQRTVLYFAGHGYESKGNVTLGLWNQERLPPRELVKWLDGLPPGHRFIGVFAQCHSGGFSTLMYPEASPTREASPADRCAFFASPLEEVAAGCTPEANRADPDDYSSWFFSALEGRRSRDIPLPGSADLDGDDRVSLEEAHGFARIHDGTLDVPVTTSEEYLVRATAPLDVTGLLVPGGPLPHILKKTRKVEQKVIASLAARLGLSQDPYDLLRARPEAARLRGERAALGSKEDELEKRLSTARDRLKRTLLNQWPWLGNPYHPLAGEVLQRDRANVVTFVQQSRDFQELNQIQADLSELRGRSAVLKETWARWERLARAVDAAAREHHLRGSGARSKIRKLDALRRCEADFW